MDIDRPTASRWVRGTHCWVGSTPHDRKPGLLIEWRHEHGHWHGRVIYATLHEQRPAMVEEWLLARHLHPVDASSSEPDGGRERSAANESGGTARSAGR